MLLREVIQHFLLELASININKLKSIKDRSKQYGYVVQFLTPVAKPGSSRQAFIFDSKKVLKMAINNAGLGQNRAEVEYFTNPASRPIITKIFDFDPNYSWVLAEIIKAFKTPEEFKTATGFEWNFFTYAVNIMGIELRGNGTVQQVQQYAAIQNKTAFINNFIQFMNKPPLLVTNTLRAMKEAKLGAGDIATLDHWGRTADGRVVLLDYGYTKEVFDTYYKARSPENFETIKPDVNARTQPAKPVVDVNAPTQVQQADRNAPTKR